ncbi:hypothetical protein GH810_08560 [Acetobacterium paludosum]|uniref:PucR C-terminal helix-turn-helix domain-containing protein n=1 Tax=Acetobacterium paludosum TaxID=52693 RepID=A0A923I3F2_9FIRM|nr:helix-turn-helix domain-containing protein [Acetobacterium paludosum]MBC3888360.1 hypothetical protein [Acetobacterium paludosum]
MTKISINIIEKVLSNHIVQKNIRDDADMVIDTYEIYNPNHFDFRENCLYLMKSEDLPDSDAVPVSLNVVCWGIPEGFEIKKYKNINLLMVEGITPEKNINFIISIFHRYNSLEERLNSLILENASLQEIIDLATEMVEMPVNILDLNHKVLAISTEMDAPDDPIWKSLKLGYMTEYYENILNTSPTMRDIIKAKGSSIEITSSISGHHVQVSLLRSGGRPIAYFGMHKFYETRKPFDKHTLQLYEYLFRKINRNSGQYFEMKADRGLIYEEFLLNLFNRKFKDSDEIDALLVKLGFDVDSSYQMALISFRNSDIRADLYFTIMDYLEKVMPNSKCIAMDLYIYIIIPIGGDDYLSDETQKIMTEFLDLHHCLCILSPPFESFLKLHKFNPMFETVLGFIKKQGREDRLYHFYEFADLYGMKLLAEEMPTERMVHPMIQKLLDYDAEHKSDYFETFKVYLRNESSISTTSNLLHMHRNSLQYRINRIEQLLGDHFDDWKLRELLLFQMKCLEYQDIFLK